MNQQPQIPTIVLICHETDRLDLEGLASWLATTMNLVGLIVIREGSARRWRVARRQMRREGWVSVLDALAFRAYRQIALARGDGDWKERTLRRLRARFQADLSAVRQLIV